MKFCTHCGKEILDEAVICIGCGCAVDGKERVDRSSADISTLISTLSQRVLVSGIIWFAIGILQIVGGLMINEYILIVGVLNIVSAILDLNYSRKLSEESTGIVARFEPVVAPIIALAYNLVIGGVVGVVGSIYYFVAIRSFVMENKETFAGLDT